jgi:hypothetical protein
VTTSQAALYPRTYSASTSWKAVNGTLALCIGLGGLVGLWYFGTGHGTQSTSDLRFFTGMSALAVLAGFMSAVGMYRGKIVTLMRDELRVPRGYKLAVVRRDHIEGWRVLSVKGSKFIQVAYSEPGSGKTTRARIPMEFEPDAAFTDWFKGLPNLDDVEKANSIREVEQDARLGDSPAHRVERVARAREIARVLKIAGFAAMGWAFLYPRPYIAAILATAALPWIALWLSWKDSAFSLEDVVADNEARGNLSLLLWTPGIAIGMRALFDIRLIHPVQLVLPALLGVALMVTCLLRVAPSYRKKVGGSIVTAAFLCVYSGGTIAIANTVLDYRQPARYRLQVLNKRTKGGKQPTQYFTVPNWGPYGHENEIEVSRRLFRQTEPGQSICIQLHPGAIGLQWYSVRPLDAC